MLIPARIKARTRGIPRQQLFGCALCALLACAALLPLCRARAANPAAGTITPGTAGPLTWNGTAPGIPPTGGGETSCTEGTNCDSYKLTISGQPADWAGKQVHVQIDWTEPGTDYDMYIHKGALTGAIVASSGNGGTTSEQVDLDPNRSSIGTGDFYVHVVYFVSAGVDQYHGTAFVAATAQGPAPAPQATGIAPRYEVYNPPAGSGLGLSSGEPSIGVNWQTGNVMFQSDVQTLRVSFTDACFPALRSIWVNKPAPTSQVDSDPILFTDHQTGRTQVSLLALLTGRSESSYTDNDGDVWVASQGSSITSGIDHQTVGGGPFAPPLKRPAGTVLSNAVYYCSQDLVTALCARSDDGGETFGPAVPVYTSECGGLHGHVKVAPDGTVYLPNKGCGSNAGVVVSKDNGISWTIQRVPGSTPSGSDPSVGIGTGGRIYYAYADGDTKPAVAVSDDQGRTWKYRYDVGAALGINNVVFSDVVAGDNNRAAYAFVGTTVAGGLQGPRFAGVWHLYVAHTYDGGQSWLTVDVTPNDPVQRGCVWLGGGANICRNLLDFKDATVDAQGRMLIGYADGCAGGECIQAQPSATGNSYTALAAIARQTGGRRLFAAFDPPATATVPGMPAASVRRAGSTAHVGWSEADNGGSAITSYKIYRGTTSGGEALLATVAGTQSLYDDPTATDPSAVYFYRVTAVNAQGESCGNNEVSARFVGDACNGFTVATDPAGDNVGGPATPQYDIQSLTVSEPGGTNNLVFRLKVGSLVALPPASRWLAFWNSQASPGGQFYVAMTTSNAGVPSFEYGTINTAVVGLVLGVPTTTKVGDATGSSFNADGTITFVIAKDKVGAPAPGDLLGKIVGRTYADNTNNVRSTNAADSTGNAQANDNTASAATYLLAGNGICP